MKLLAVVSDEFGLVCGSETGHDAAVPYCDYFEGMLSLGPYRIDEAGRDMWRTIDEVPERVAKYQVGERYRLPLWELVYHDCCVAQWYWGDYNNKLPATWKKRDLFNALYATPPMYLFHAHDWKKWRARVLASVPAALEGAKAAGLAGQAATSQSNAITEEQQAASNAAQPMPQSALPGTRPTVRRTYLNPAVAAAQKRAQQAGPKLGRNDPCWCGSGLKYKKCHGKDLE